MRKRLVLPLPLAPRRISASPGRSAKLRPLKTSRSERTQSRFRTSSVIFSF